ncbi:unnamed protein product, partial [Effrenium voratum]
VLSARAQAVRAELREVQGAMFSWFSGSNCFLCPRYDSTIEPGKKGMISEAIEDMTPEKFETQFWKWVDNMPAMTTYQTGRTVTGSKDTAMVAEHQIEVSGLASLLVSFKANLYFKYYAKDGLYYMENYAGDKEVKLLGHRTILKPVVGPDGFKVEVFDEELPTRRAGPFLKGLMEGDLKGLKMEGAKVEADQPSPSTPGEKSLIATNVPDMTTESLWEQAKAQALESGTGTEQADGSVKLEITGWLSATTFAIMAHSKEKDELVRFDFGDDAECKEAISTSYTKVLKDPPRIERWVMPKAAVLCDEK